MLHSSLTLATPRLELVPLSVELARAHLRGRSTLGRLLNAQAPKSWPPPLVDSAIIKWMLKKLATDADYLIWGSRYFVLAEPRSLIGLGGFKGPPGADG